LDFGINKNLNTQSVEGVIARTIGEELASKVIVERIEAESGYDVFEIESRPDRLIIRGSSGVAASSGFYWYLKHVCKSHLSWCGSRVHVPYPFPEVSIPVRKVTPYQYRYYLNYCTHSYSMAFWDWDRWQKEIDWMALNGINLVLSLVGQEEVWRRTLVKLGYTEAECKEFLCGPAYFAWQWMQNMTGWGGPLPDWWFTERALLARKIHERMLSLDIMPVLQGYSGMVPNDFQRKFPESEPVAQGKWCEFERPSLLLPSDSMYRKVASTFYSEQTSLFGNDIHYYSTDPFHEGGRTEGIDLTAYARDVQAIMREYDDEAVWVLQAWQENPHSEVLAGLDKDHALVLDLWCESQPAWVQRNAFDGTPWVWCMIQNYGGKNGLFGNLRLLMQEPVNTIGQSRSGRMSGIGLAMEGIETNPVVYDLMTDMIWRTESPGLTEWLEGYIERRYGKVVPQALQAWLLLADSVYNCTTVQQGAVESIICARPHLDITNVSTWGPTGSYYDQKKIQAAARLLLEGFDELRHSEGYLYDLVDITRQAMADLAREYYHAFVAAYRSGEKEEYAMWSNRFLSLGKAQDQLLGTRKEFLLGRWIEQARSLGRTTEEKDRFQFNAVTLVTLWGPEKSAQSLRDYSHREWSGLISGFYYRRWEKYIASLTESLDDGRDPEPVDWYRWELEWTQNPGTYSTEPSGNVKQIVSELLEEYFS